jgi:GNAT superfamily N-acetyltransferase
VPATPADADVCLGIQRAAAVAAFQHVFPKQLYPFPDEEIRADWLATLSDPEVEAFLAYEAAEAVGCVSVGHGLLRTLYVVPHAWSHGIGGALHDLGLDRLREANVEEARLWTLSENQRGRAFYERRGWKLTGGTRVVPFPPNPIDVEYARSTLRSPA